jgi:hypothetical protein
MIYYHLVGVVLFVFSLWYMYSTYVRKDSPYYGNRYVGESVIGGIVFAAVWLILLIALWPLLVLMFIIVEWANKP